MNEIHVLNFLIQLTAPYATCTMALNRTWKQPPATLVRYRAGNGCVHRYSTRSSLPSDASHERFPVKLGDFGLAMPLKAGVLVTKHWAESLAERNAWRSAEWFVIKISSLFPFRNQIPFLKPYCQSGIGHQAHSLYCNRRIRSRRSDLVSRCTSSAS